MIKQVYFWILIWLISKYMVQQGSLLFLFNISNVHCLVFPPSPPMNLKRWIVQNERLFYFRHLGQSQQLANDKQSFLLRNNHFLLLAFYKGLGNMCTFLDLKKYHNVFLQMIIQKYYIRAFYCCCWACFKCIFRYFKNMLNL